MSDDEMSPEDRERVAAQLREMERKVTAGEPLMAFTVDSPLRVSVDPSGAVTVDFFGGLATNYRAFVVRLSVTSAAAQILKATLKSHENIPDSLPPARDKDQAN